MWFVCRLILNAARCSRTRSWPRGKQRLARAGTSTMNREIKRDIRLINMAGALGTVYFRLALAEIFLLFVTRCLRIPKETWALVAAILPVTGAFHIASAYLTERIGRRKPLSLCCFAVSRLAVPAITLLPFFTGENDYNFRLYYLAVAMLAQSAISNLAASAWLSWVADIVPSEERGRFYSSRFMFIAIFDVAVLMTAGHLLDFICTWNQPPGSPPDYANPWGYVVIFGLAFVAGEADLIIHARVADRPLPHREEKLHVWSMLVEPWRHAGFRSLMFFRLFFAIGEGIAVPFGAMYLFEELSLSAATVTTLVALFLLSNVLTYKIWQRVGDRFGYRTVLSISSTLVGAGLVYYLFLPQSRPEIALIVLAAGYLGHGTVWSGVNLSLSTLIMNVAPPKHRSMYFAQITTLLGLVMGVTMLCGRWIYIWTNPASDVFFLGTKITGVHVLFGIAAAVRILSVPLFLRRVPDARAEVTFPRLERILRASPLRILPALLSVERPLSAAEREEHVDSMKKLIPPGRELQLDGALELVLKDHVREEEEFYSILGRERVKRGKGLERMLEELAGSGGLSRRPAWGKAAARRIRRLYERGDLVGCLRTVGRLAARTADGPQSERAASARAVIEAFAEPRAAGPMPGEDAVLLAVYAYLQLIRETER